MAFKEVQKEAKIKVMVPMKAYGSKFKKAIQTPGPWKINLGGLVKYYLS